MAVLETLSEILKLLLVLITGYATALWRLLVPPKRKSVKGQVALITGAGHGIGREISLELSRAGAVVVLWDVNEAGNEETAQLVRNSGGRAFTEIVDVTDTSRVAQAADAIRRDVGEVSILVNNAGVINCAPLLDLMEKDIRRTFEVNTLAHFWLVREFLASMQKRNVGHIVNISSMSSFHGTQLMTDYSASKSAVRGFSDALRRELNLDPRNGIKITCVCPMFVDTGFLRTANVRPEDILTPQRVAVETVDGVLRNKELIIVPAIVEYSIRLAGLLPSATYEIISKGRAFDVHSQYKKEG